MDDQRNTTPWFKNATTAFVLCMVFIILMVPLSASSNAQGTVGLYYLPYGNAQQNGLSNYNTTNAGNGTLWTYASDSEYYFRDLTMGSDGTIYFTTMNNNFYNSLFAFYPNGSLKWRADDILGMGADNVLVIGSDGTIYTIVNLAYNPPAPSGTFALQPIMSPAVMAIDPTNGSMKWTYQPQDGSMNSTRQLALSPNGELVFATNSTVIALNSNGSLAWSLSMVPYIEWTSTYNATEDNEFNGYEKAVWGVANSDDLFISYKTSLQGDIAIAPDSTIYITSMSGNLFSISPKGQLLQNISIPGSPNRLFMAIDGESNVYITGLGSRGDHIFKFYPNGVEAWNYGVSNCYYNSILIDKLGEIYLEYTNSTGSNSDSESTTGIILLDADGSEIWSMEHEIGEMAMSADGILYIAGHDHLFALRSDGSIYWQKDVMHSPSPLVATTWGGGQDVAIGPDGTVYFIVTLQLLNGVQNYLMAIKGTPSVHDASLDQQIILPLVCGVVIVAMLAILYRAKRRGDVVEP